MSHEEIIKLARKAGIAKHGLGWTCWEGQLERFATIVAAAEREACAAVCCDMIDAEHKTGKVDHNEMAWTQACAIAIRARGNT